MKKKSLPTRLGTMAVAAIALAATPGVAAERQQSGERIVGGTQVEPGTYPWMTALLQADVEDANFAQFCGGSLIREDWVLTAAHCVESAQPGELNVLVGREDLAGSGGERIAVEEIVINPGYQDRGSPDLALLRLADKSNQQAIDLAESGSAAAAPGTVATVTGWGRTSENGPASPDLLEVDVPIVTQSVCDAAYGGIVEDDMVCAGLSEGGKDSCFGDSGGPLFVPSPQGEGVRQVGVVSFGSGCAKPGFPGVYARVSTHQAWIAETVGERPAAPQEDDGELVARFSAKCSALDCRFDAGKSTSDGPVELYVWNFGDGMFDFGVRTRHSYAEAGKYEATLFVLTKDGRIADKTRTVTARKPGNTAANTKAD